MRGIIVVLLLALGEIAIAQAPQPQLSTTEMAALSYIIEAQHKAQAQLDAANRAMKEVEADIAKAHPGFHYSPELKRLEKDLPPAPVGDKK